METNLEKLRQGHIHNQTHKHLERVRGTGLGVSSCYRIPRPPSCSPLADLLVASPTGDCDPEEIEDEGKGSGQGSSKGSPRNPPPGSCMASVGLDWALNTQ